MGDLRRWMSSSDSIAIAERGVRGRHRLSDLPLSGALGGFAIVADGGFSGSSTGRVSGGTSVVGEVVRHDGDGGSPGRVLAFGRRGAPGAQVSHQGTASRQLAAPTGQTTEQPRSEQKNSKKKHSDADAVAATATAADVNHSFLRCALQ